MQQLNIQNVVGIFQNCGSHAAVTNGGRVAYRPNANFDYNFGIVLTNRALNSNEIFEVRLDKMVSKWGGSIEIGKFSFINLMLHLSYINFCFDKCLLNILRLNCFFRIMIFDEISTEI